MTHGAQARTGRSDAPLVERFLTDVFAGLARMPKSIPSKYLYDERGMQLYERICALEEYYPARTEAAILQDHAREISAAIGPQSHIIEYGSGNGQKTWLLLDALECPVAYVPVDVAVIPLLEASSAIARGYPSIDVHPVHADFTKPLQLPALRVRPRRKVVFFPGSTIGNCTALEAAVLLQRAANLVGKGGGMLIGIDLDKAPRMLERAYDDSAGVTRAFNLNLLERINRELGGTFRPNTFGYRARYDPTFRRIEAHLVSRVAQRVRVGARTFSFTAGEPLLTEYAHKYTIASFTELVRVAGMALCSYWTDPKRLFAVCHLVVP